MRWVVAVIAMLQSASVQGQRPHLTGSVRLEPREGLIVAATCVSGFEPRNRLRFLLNETLNISTVTDSAGTAILYDGEFNGRIVGEGREYIVAPRDTVRRIGRFCVNYRGAVPVFDSNTATEDWKGRIAAMQGTIRASEQSRWFPVLFDSATTSLETEVTYDLTVDCATCQSIYMNGAAPQAGTSGRFVSTTPRPAMLFAGAFSFTTTPELSFVAGSAGPNANRAFGTTIRDIANYYAQLLSIPYNERPTLLTFRSISRDRRPGVADWQFVTWPTIAMSGGISFDSVLVIQGAVPAVPRPLWTTLSHEMGHYYFGTRLRPVGPLRWFVLESMAEYLSLKAVKTLLGSAAGTARLIDVVQGMGTPTLPTLDRITREEQVNGTYRYNYAPAFLMALEERQGERRMVSWLRELLALPSSTVLSFENVAAAAERAGIPRSALTQAFEADSIRQTHATVARRTLETSSGNVATTRESAAIATALINIDTTVTDRLSLMRHLEQVVRLDSTRIEALYQIGRIGALTGRELEKARAALERYVHVPLPAGSPSHAAAYWRLGMIEEHAGRPDQARAAYRRALEIDPAYAAARDALARLGPRRFDRSQPKGRLR